MAGDDALTGRLLGGRYRLLRLLGQGGMGSVYEAAQENLGRLVAVKVLAEELRGELLYLERFRREAEVVARLQHPHIVQVVDFVQHPGEPVFFVMERLEGEPLLSVVQRGALPCARACRIMVQLLAALEAAHRAGVVHRDLKPANVFLVSLAGGDLVKLLDFGVAKLKESHGYSRLTETGVIIGTPRFASPEQVLGRRDVDARTDIFSAGVLLYSMLAGRPPFTSQGAQLLVDIETLEPADPRTFDPSIPSELVAIVRRAMQKRPDPRFPSARAMSAAIEPFIHSMAVPAPLVPGSSTSSLASTQAHGGAPTSTPAHSTSAPHSWNARSTAWFSPSAEPVAIPSTSVGGAQRPHEPTWSGGPSAAAHPATRPGAPSRAPRSLAPWALAIVALVLAGAIAAVVVGRLAFGRVHDRAQQGAAPSFEPSEAARHFGPDCVEYERIACTCAHPSASRWCSDARRTFAEDSRRQLDPASDAAVRTSCRMNGGALRGVCGH